MGSYGLKISQPFYDATTAADANLLFSSSWPTIPIAAEKTFTNVLYGGSDDFNGTTLTFNHNLGFVPFTAVWTTTFSPRLTSRYVGGPFSPTFDANNAYVGVSNALYQVHVTCYNINLGTDVDYPYIKTSGATALYDNDFGLKIAKSGKDITSNDMRDFILHTRCQSPQILAVKTEKSAVDSALGGGTRDIIYTPPVTTPLWAFGYQRDSTNTYIGVYYYSQSYPRLFVTPNTNGTYTYQLNFGPAASNFGATLLLMRDPMFASNDLTASY